MMVLIDKNACRTHIVTEKRALIIRVLAYHNRHSFRHRSESNIIFCPQAKQWKQKPSEKLSYEHWFDESRAKTTHLRPFTKIQRRSDGLVRH